MPDVSEAPPESGNGGYVAGRLGVMFDGIAEVTLRKPPPLDKPLRLVNSDDGRHLMDGETLVAEAKPATLEVEVPECPPYEEAVEQAKHYPGFDAHPFPDCFVCGPHRDEGDGLRIFNGRTDLERPAAAPWTPDASLAGDDGNVDPVFLWAALDCPSFFGVAAPYVAVLGRMTARLHHPLRAGDRAVSLGWREEVKERKAIGCSAVFGQDGRLVAEARCIWVRIG